MTHLHIDVWSADITQFSIKLVDFGANGIYQGGDDVEHQINYPSPAQGQWVSYDIPLSDFTGLTTTSNIAQYILVGQPTAATTIWIDNMYFYTDGGGSGDTGPATAAPTPSVNSADVISIFSDAYTDVTVDKWSADWDAADVVDFTVGSDNVKKITFSPGNYAGIEFLNNKIDASGMTHFHMDIWTPDAIEAGNNFIIKFSDWTGGSGETSFHELQVLHTASGDVPALETGTWVSIEVPLSVFSNPASPYTEVAQLVLTANGIGTLYFDNVYYHK
jgi:hypothetical protein